MQSRHMFVNLDLLLLPQNGIVLELCRTAASQNHHCYQFAGKWAERGYCDESDVVLCVKQLKNCFSW